MHVPRFRSTGLRRKSQAHGMSDLLFRHAHRVLGMAVGFHFLQNWLPDHSRCSRLLSSKQAQLHNSFKFRGPLAISLAMCIMAHTAFQSYAYRDSEFFTNSAQARISKSLRTLERLGVQFSSKSQLKDRKTCWTASRSRSISAIFHEVTAAAETSEIGRRWTNWNDTSLSERSPPQHSS